VGSLSEGQPIQYVLVVEAFQLQVSDSVDGEGHDGTFLLREISIAADNGGRGSSPQDEMRGTSTIESEAEDFRVMEARHMTEPSQEISSSRNAFICHGSVISAHHRKLTGQVEMRQWCIPTPRRAYAASASAGGSAIAAAPL
jgi:hypothetical protein